MGSPSLERNIKASFLSFASKKKSVIGGANTLKIDSSKTEISVKPKTKNHKRKSNIKMNYINYNNNDKPVLKAEELISFEVKRLADKYDKAFLDCVDIAELTGLGRDNARALMNGRGFPITRVGNRQVVSILAFVTWQLASSKGVTYGAN